MTDRIDDNDQPADTGPGSWPTSLDSLRALLGLSDAEVASVLRRTEAEFVDWKQHGIPVDVMRAAMAYEDLAKRLGAAAAIESRTPLTRLVRTRLDSLGGQSVLGALARDDRDAVERVIVELRQGRLRPAD